MKEPNRACAQWAAGLPDRPTPRLEMGSNHVQKGGPSTMNIANALFSCFVASIREEIERLQKSGVLDHCHAEQRGSRVRTKPRSQGRYLKAFRFTEAV
jgi:hypothetical protein